MNPAFPGFWGLCPPKPEEALAVEYYSEVKPSFAKASDFVRRSRRAKVENKGVIHFVH
jgi:hypothetical protein